MQALHLLLPIPGNGSFRPQWIQLSSSSSSSSSSYPCVFAAATAEAGPTTMLSVSVLSASRHQAGLLGGAMRAKLPLAVSSVSNHLFLQVSWNAFTLPEHCFR
jgi:hypothetical protein